MVGGAPLEHGVTISAIPGTDAATEAAPATARHFTLAVLALAIGGFAIGTTEFVTMGLLPQIAAGVDVSIPTGRPRDLGVRRRRRRRRPADRGSSGPGCRAGRCWSG